MLPESKPKRKKMNAADRRALYASDIQLFIQNTGRKARKGYDPNDRSVSREQTLAVRHMKPDELDRLMRDGEDEL